MHDHWPSLATTRGPFKQKEETAESKTGAAKHLLL